MGSEYLPKEFSYIELGLKQLMKAIVTAQQYEEVIVYNWAGEVYESLMAQLECLDDTDYAKVIGVVDDLLPIEWCFWMAEAEMTTLALAKPEASLLIH